MDLRKAGLATLLNWATLLTVIGGSYWYLEDTRRELEDIMDEIHEFSDREEERDSAWLKEELSEFDRIQEELAAQGQERLDRVIELRADHRALMAELSAMRAEVAQALGRHEGRHDAEGR